MQNVSQGWIDANAQNFLPLSDVKLTYYVDNTDATQHFSNFTYTAGNYLIFNYQNVLNRNINYKKIIVLDKGSFILDGGCVPYDTTSIRGIVLKPSNANSVSVLGQFFYINFSQQITTNLDYITIKWGEVNSIAPHKVIISWYSTASDGSLVGSTTYNIADNEFISKIPLNISNFQKLKVEYFSRKTDVAQYVELIAFGDSMQFGKDDIVKIVQKDIIDPNNLSLPTHTLQVELNNTDERFNPDNPSGIYSYLKEGQQLNLQYGLKINGVFEYINGGTYFLTKWNVPQNGITATFEAGSKLDFLNDIYKNGSSTIRNNLSTYNTIVIGEIAAWFNKDNTLLQNEGYSSLLNGYKQNEVLQFICNAERIKLYIDKDGIIHMDELFDGDLSNLTQESYTIGQNVSFNYGDYEIIRPLKEVIMTYATDTSNTDVKETTSTGIDGVSQTLENPIISTSQNASDVNNQVINVLKNSKIISGSFRPDIRLEVWDKIYITNKYAVNLSVLITELEITYNGAFSGTYKGIIEG